MTIAIARISDAPLDAAAHLAAVEQPWVGAVTSFIGTVRAQDPEAAVSIAYAALTEGEEYVLIDRFGISGKQELKTGDIYSAYPVRLSVKEGLVPGGEGELEFSAQFRSTGAPARDKTIVAA